MPLSATLACWFLSIDLPSLKGWLLPGRCPIDCLLSASAPPAKADIRLLLCPPASESLYRGHQPPSALHSAERPAAGGSSSEETLFVVHSRIVPQCSFQPVCIALFLCIRIQRSGGCRTHAVPLAFANLICLFLGDGSIRFPI